MAIESRKPPAGAIIHSDQGVQFGSWAFTGRAKASGLVPSMGSVGDCFDNSMIEAFWSRHADRTARPAQLAHPHRADQRDLRLPRDLAQPPPPAQRPGLAVATRVRKSKQDRRGRLIIQRPDSGKPGAPHSEVTGEWIGASTTEVPDELRDRA